MHKAIEDMQDRLQSLESKCHVLEAFIFTLIKTIDESEDGVKIEPLIKKKLIDLCKASTPQNGVPYTYEFEIESLTRRMFS
jgi:hypothetical protein